KHEQLSRRVGMDIQEYTQVLLQRMKLHSPFAGIRIEDRQAIIEETLASGSTKSNPRTVTADDVSWFLDRLFTSEE
ncbi:MAG: hypothetical protein KAH38_00405, partial [Candidatus Hydrogenedentes bacterium]|nr:hypothetical protein [Candidatus Hydrogenedentota bacterium]